MADQVETPTDATEAEVTDNELENVVGGSALLKIDGIEGESTDSRHKDQIH